MLVLAALTATNCALVCVDKTVIMWKLTRDETNYGIPQRALRGHSHFVSDVVVSSDGQFALSGSWDWDAASVGPHHVRYLLSF